MAEIDRDLLRSRDREGRPLTPSAKLVLTYLWTFPSAGEALGYRRRELRAPRTRPLPTSQIAAGTDLSVRQVQRELRTLEEARLILRTDRGGIELFDLVDQARLLRLDPEVASQIKPPRDTGDASFSSPVGDTGDAPRDTGDASTRHPGRPDATPRTSHPLGVPVGSQLGPEGGSRARPRRLCEPTLTEIAREIVLLAPQPPGCAALPATDDGLVHLVALLVAGWPRDQIVDVLAVAPELIAEGLEPPRFYGPEMFRGERWSIWRGSAAAFRHRECSRRTAPVESVEEAVRRRDDAERRAQELREEQALAAMIEAIEHPPVPGEFDRKGDAWRVHPRWRVSLLFRPDEAVRVGRATIAAAKAAGRAVDSRELAWALSSVEVTEDMVHGPGLAGQPQAETAARGDLVLERLQALRRRAEAEGRRPTLAELQEVGQCDA